MIFAAVAGGGSAYVGAQTPGEARFFSACPHRRLIHLHDERRPWDLHGGEACGPSVPNGHSINRLLGTKMGMLKHPCELGPRDHKVGHRRVYTKSTLIADIHASELRTLWTGGVFFKPFSAAQMQEICTDDIITGLYELGKDFQDNAAELYAVCAV